MQYFEPITCRDFEGVDAEFSEPIFEEERTGLEDKDHDINDFQEKLQRLQTHHQEWARVNPIHTEERPDRQSIANHFEDL